MGKRSIFLMPITLVMLMIGFSSNDVPVYAFSDTSSMTDQDFFGVWDSAASAWTTSSKINYSYSSSLTSVENDVKQGDYTSAKADLLTYFKNRTGIQLPELPAASDSLNTKRADVAIDHIFSDYGESLANTFTVNGTPAWSSVDVTKTINNQLKIGQITLLLMAREKESELAKFYSKEAASNKPYLAVTVGGVEQHIFPTKDTFIRPGAYGDINHGSSALLEVKDSGVPFDDYTRRTYMQFDLTGITGTPSSVTLNLYGSNVSDSANKEIMVYTTGDTQWSEAGMTWNNEMQLTYSWQGVSGGTDWNNYSSVPGWINDVIRFGFLNTITSEYLRGEDEQYASGAISLMLDFIQDKGASSTDNYINGGGYTNSLSTGSRASNWVQDYHYLKNSSSMDADADTAILKYFWGMADFLNYDKEYPRDVDDWFLAHYHPTNNWGVAESTGLFYIAGYFPEFQDAAEWKNTAKSRMDDLIQNLNYPDGSYHEASSGYAGTTTDNFLDYRTFSDLNNETLSSTFDSQLQNMAQYLANLSLPNGYEPQYGDSDYNDQKPRVNRIGTRFNNDYLTYFGTAGSSGTEPYWTSILYPDLQRMGIMRTGWSDNDLYLSINNGSGSGSHSQPDDLALTAYAYGQRLLVDTGRKDYSGDEASNWLRTTTQAQNTIEINNTRQTIVSQGQIKSWNSNGAFDFYEGDNTTAYPGFNADRSVLFIKPSFWIVSDYISGGSGVNHYEQTWHMLPNANASLDSSTAKIATHFNDSANIQIVPADPSSLTSSLPTGYYSDDLAVVTNAVYGSYVKNASGDITFDTVLYPTTSTDTDRDVSVNRLTLSPDVSITTATAIQINLDNGNNGDIGYYYLSHEVKPTSSYVFGDFEFDGKMAYVQKDANGILKSAIIKSGSTLKQNTTNILDYGSSVIRDMAVAWNGTTLSIQGEGLVPTTSTTSGIAIYAPNVTNVKLNGTTTGYSRSGDYIYAVEQNDLSANQIFYPRDDSTIRDGSYADTNFGSSNVLTVKKDSVGYNRKSLLKFNFNPLNAGTTGQASLNLYVKTAPLTSQTINIYAIDDLSWSDPLVNWNNAPPKGSLVASFTVDTTAEKWYSIDVTDYINNHMDSQTASFIVENDGIGGSQTGVSFSSHENVGARPYLSIKPPAHLTPVADAFVRDGTSSDTNFGSETSLLLKNDSVNYNRKSYIKFDFGDYEESSTSKAMLRLFVRNTGTAASRTIDVYAVSDNTWDENSITWNNAPQEGTLLGQIPNVSTTAKAEYQFDITDYVNSHMNDKVISILLKVHEVGDSQTGVTLFSREFPTEEPLLEIN
ncbi:DNRLRE domain-containing protein [Paenibacillus sp. HB172176]|uniref:CBM96 family carbohydrate-binding protein n=1 Tax=Paenibacillus sp. HB172176 TaxID=2493690 RepID=UPI00143C8F4B|nr:DNRLRE domain-containing protein [Paenibacillus sp. HB172176]